MLCQGLGISKFLHVGDVIAKIFPLDSVCPKTQKGSEIGACLHDTLFALEGEIQLPQCFLIAPGKLSALGGKQDVIALLNFLMGLGFQISLRNTSTSAVSLTD